MNCQRCGGLMILEDTGALLVPDPVQRCTICSHRVYQPLPEIEVDLTRVVQAEPKRVGRPKKVHRPQCRKQLPFGRCYGRAVEGGTLCDAHSQPLHVPPVVPYGRRVVQES